MKDMDQFNEAYAHIQSGLDKLRELRPHWVRVDLAPPPKGKAVLGFYPEMGAGRRVVVVYRMGPHYFDNDDHEQHAPTYWRPLPPEPL